MTDNPDVADKRRCGGIGLSEAVSAVIPEIIIPQIAEVATVYVLERLLLGEEPTARAGDDMVVVRRMGTCVAGTRLSMDDPAFPAGEVIAFPAQSPSARCMRNGASVIFSKPAAEALDQMQAGARVVLGRYDSFMVAPLIANDSVLGFLALARAPGNPGLTDTESEGIAKIAARAAASVDAGLAALRQRSAAAMAGLSVASAVPPRTLAGVEIAGRCLPAAGYDVGGDWYDIVSLAAGRAGVIVGDVMGHGVQAAVTMAQLSTAARALAGLDLEPADLLGQLSRAAEELPDGTLATCSYAVIDPAAHACTIATAGHLPPVLALPDGTTRIPELPGGQSLGIGVAAYGQARIRLLPGTVLAVYTDGLVETRTRPFNQGILALREVLARGHEHLETTCDALIETLGDRREDDITVVLTRLT